MMKGKKIPLKENIRKDSLEKMSARWSNSNFIIVLLIHFCLRAERSRLLKMEHEKDPYDWRKDKSLSVNNEKEVKDEN